MIQRTFQLVPGIGPWRERDLWARGIQTWDDFPAEGAPVAVSSKVDAQARLQIARTRAALEARDLAQLGRLMPSREHWRCYPAFAPQAVFFDIEAEDPRSPQPTVVSLFHAEGLEVFIQGRNLDELPKALSRWPLWVTYNGSCFDVPVLRTHFPELALPALHIDLRFLARRLEFRGGLKQLEDTLGVGRPPHLRGVNGYDAVLLWREYQLTGDVEALRFLTEYNLYDAIQLRSVMELMYNRAADRLACDIVPLQPFDRGEVLYDISRLLLELSPTQADRSLLARVRGEADVQRAY